ncbi:MAG TPA: glucose-6-phosphate dehydrogenase [Actinomycetota bacterium]|nr:glucose-6-phosphate dehydrogenase [Actinomycetota bacterium]
MPLPRPGPQAIVIFGASGDLTKRKILPALYNLAKDGLLPERAAVVGFARAEWDDDSFRKHARTSIENYSHTPLDPEVWKRLEPAISFVRGSFDDPERMAALSAHLESLDAEPGTDGGRLYYLATPPSAFPRIVEGLGSMPGGPGAPDRARIIVEKPFGHDLDSARRLNEVVHGVFDEPQVFRIDHYLGKETVQNLVTFRFANSLWERMWNRDAIDHVQFTVAEAIGVERRGRYYEEAGAIRDLVQNHMIQVLAFLAMEPPRSLDPEAFRDEKVKVMRAMRPLDPADVVRGQYAAGPGGQAYRDEENVAADSTVETFVAVRLFIDNWRWEGVPFYLRHGKHLPERSSEVVVVFREAPPYLFRQAGIESLPPNHLIIRIQPDEGIALSFQAKHPGPGITLQEVLMDFRYGDSFMTAPAEAYERLIHDAMGGDHTLFPREDGVERSWELVAEELANPGPIHMYPAGSWGPGAADELIAPRQWHLGGDW